MTSALAHVRAEVQRQVCVAFVREEPDAWTPVALELAAVSMRSDVDLNTLALVADQLLAWDSQAFVNACGVSSRDIRAEDLTRADYRTLTSVNDGRQFTYPLNHWST